MCNTCGRRQFRGRPLISFLGSPMWGMCHLQHCMCTSYIRTWHQKRLYLYSTICIDTFFYFYIFVYMYVCECWRGFRNVNQKLDIIWIRQHYRYVQLAFGCLYTILINVVLFVPVSELKNRNLHVCFDTGYVFWTLFLWSRGHQRNSAKILLLCLFVS